MDMPFFIWKNENSMSNKVIVNKLPDIIKPAANVQKIQIPGRHGFITQDEGTYQSVIKPVICSIGEDANIDYINNWLTGSGEVIFSDQPDRYYKSVIINQISYGKVIRLFKKFIIQFDCQPFGYSTNKDIITLTTSGNIANNGFSSEPYIKVTGSGNITLTINGKNIILTGVSSYIEIDSEMMNCFKGNTNCNNQMQGEFPILVSGTNTISWTGTVTQVEFQPRWRWV